MHEDRVATITRQVRRAADGTARLQHAMFVVAHPDDETIGGGAMLSQCDDPRVVIATDGSPHDTSDARRVGFETRRAYANARRAECLAAMARAGISSEHVIWLDHVDQETPRALAELVEQIDAVLTAHSPDVVFTHPYEGGHPDHDAVAFAVQTAIEHRFAEQAPVRFEMAFYHWERNGMHTGEFLSRDDADVIAASIERERLDQKRAQFACYGTQKRVLESFDPAIERYRLAPHYDFTRPPHPGTLLYETWPIEMTGARWRALVTDALLRMEAS